MLRALFYGTFIMTLLVGTVWSPVPYAMMCIIMIVFSFVDVAIGRMIEFLAHRTRASVCIEQVGTLQSITLTHNPWTKRVGLLRWIGFVFMAYNLCFWIVLTFFLGEMIHYLWAQ